MAFPVVGDTSVAIWCLLCLASGFRLRLLVLRVAELCQGGGPRGLQHGLRLPADCHLSSAAGPPHPTGGAASDSVLFETIKSQEWMIYLVHDSGLPTWSLLLSDTHTPPFRLIPGTVCIAHRSTRCSLTSKSVVRPVRTPSTAASESSQTRSTSLTFSQVPLTTEMNNIVRLGTAAKCFISRLSFCSFCRLLTK